MTMKIYFLLSIIGLSLFKEAIGGNFISAEETSPRLATTEAAPVNVSSVLSNYDGLNLVRNDDHRTMGFVNVTENVGVSFTEQDEGIIIVLLDSKTGQAACLADNKVAVTKNEEFKGDVIKALNLILDNYVFKKESLPQSSESADDALELWSNVYLHLGHPKEKGSTSFRSLKYLHLFSRNLKHLYLGSLNGLIPGNGPYPLKQNLNRFLTISIGLQKLFGKAQGGLKNILSRNVTFEVNPLFNGKNGLEVLVYVLRQTGAKFDLTVLWGNLLNNIEDLLDIIGKLGGAESKNGVDETVAIVGHLWGAIHFRIPITNFIQFLFESSSEDHWSQADDGDFKEILKDVKNITDQQAKKYDTAIKLSGFVVFLTNLTTNSVIENNVNISELVEKWRKRDVIGGLHIITHITFHIFSPAKYSDLLFNSFTAFLNATSDPDSLKKILPGVSPEDFTGGGGSILNAINKQYNIDDQLKKGGNPNQILNGVPVFGQFSKVFNNALGRNFDFAKALNGGTFSDLLSRSPFTRPFQAGFDVFSHFVQQGGNFLKNIFVDPIRNFLPNFPGVPGLPNLPQLPISPNSPQQSPLPIPPIVPQQSLLPLPSNLPFLPAGILPSNTVAKNTQSDESKATTAKDVEKEEESKSTVGSSSTKKPVEDDAESESAGKSTTPSSEETHLTASISTNPTSEGSETPNEISEGTSRISTEKKGDDNEKTEESNSVTAKASTSGSTEEAIEFKHHKNKHHVQNKHHENHNQRHHHNNKQHHHRHQHVEEDHKNKHHSRKHQEKHNHETVHHNRNINENHHERKHNRDHKHEEKHLKRSLSMKHHDKKEDIHY
ncbi:uncharacterized protein LOC123685239 [Harmonia axyridis]|uniref:uncharacterized protein LOC123685239 n=1 Tax=Harmonia axyridis TaxID=115357 RepID=UPI001E2769C0|nr:uncharacterized protein LOC123685239 [Harmonia axyridis]